MERREEEKVLVHEVEVGLRSLSLHQSWTSVTWYWQDVRLLPLTSSPPHLRTMYKPMRASMPICTCHMKHLIQNGRAESSSPIRGRHTTFSANMAMIQWLMRRLSLGGSEEPWGTGAG